MSWERLETTDGVLLSFQGYPQGWAQRGHPVNVCCKLKRKGRGGGKEIKKRKKRGDREEERMRK